MNHSITILVGAMLIIGGVYIVVNMSSKVYDIDEELSQSTISNYTQSVGTDKFYIISAKFNVAKQCEINITNTTAGISDSNLIRTELKLTTNERFNVTFSPTTTYNFDIICCDLQNNCENKTYIYP